MSLHLAWSSVLVSGHWESATDTGQHMAWTGLGELDQVTCHMGVTSDQVTPDTDQHMAWTGREFLNHRQASEAVRVMSMEV